MDAVVTCLRDMVQGSRRRRWTVLLCLAVLLLQLLPSPSAGTEAELYGPGGVRPEAVRQGGLGSCYFFATLSALAQASPGVIQQLIQENGDGTYTVKFPDSKKETAYPQDLR